MINWRKAVCYSLPVFLLFACWVIKGASNEKPGGLLSVQIPRQQTTEAELWKPGDDLSAKMLERVRSEGVIRIVSIHPSGNKYLFVGEFEESWQFAPTQPPRPKTGLWLVNKDGSGLLRLSNYVESEGICYDPEWSPSGDRFAYVARGSVNVYVLEPKQGIPWHGGTITETSGPALYAQELSNDFPDDGYVEYSQPRWSPNGEALAAFASDGTTDWVEVAAKLGGPICSFKGADRYQWNSKSELVLDYGRFVFDWESLLSATEPVDNPALNKDQAEKQEVSQRLLKRLLKKVSAYGVGQIGSYSVSPSGDRIVFAGDFVESESCPDCTPYNESFKADLWLVNRDGSGLLRLTNNHNSSRPVWSPSGKQIAFVNVDSISVIDTIKRTEKRLPGLQAYHARENEDHHNTSIYLSPRWSPNGKAIAAEGSNGGTNWITVVEARSGTEIFRSGYEVYSFAWNYEGELVIGTHGKFVFDWSSGIFNRR
jgi:Tol biopolymer transport system component